MSEDMGQKEEIKNKQDSAGARKKEGLKSTVADKKATTEQTAEKNGSITMEWATGRRKTAVAQVRISPGKGEITVNRRKLEEYFPLEQYRNIALMPLKVTKRENNFDFFIRVRGGGIVAQANAIRLGISRALAKFDDSLISLLKEKYLLTRDPRMKERKKYGRRGARRGQQYSKR